MDVRAENRGRPHQKVRLHAAPVVGRNFLTPGHSGVRVRNVRRKSRQKSLCLCCFFFPEKCWEFAKGGGGGKTYRCDFGGGGGGKRAIKHPLQNQFWRPQKVGFVWSVPVSSKENDIA